MDKLMRTPAEGEDEEEEEDCLRKRLLDRVDGDQEMVRKENGAKREKTKAKSGRPR